MKALRTSVNIIAMEIMKVWKLWIHQSGKRSSTVREADVSQHKGDQYEECKKQDLYIFFFTVT